MAALAADSNVQLAPFGPDVEAAYDVVNADICYQGGFAGLSAGNARPLTAGDAFLGVFKERIDNASGAAGAERIGVVTEGVLKEVAVAGASAKTDINKQVYATNDNPADITLTIGSNTCIGHIQSYNPTSGKFDVKFRAATRRNIT